MATSLILCAGNDSSERLIDARQNSRTTELKHLLSHCSASGTFVSYKVSCNTGQKTKVLLYLYSSLSVI